MIYLIYYTVGLGGEPYNDSVRLRVVFDVKFGEHIF